MPRNQEALKQLLRSPGKQWPQLLTLLAPAQKIILSAADWRIFPPRRSCRSCHWRAAGAAAGAGGDDPQTGSPLPPRCSPGARSGERKPLSEGEGGKEKSLGTEIFVFMLANTSESHNYVRFQYELPRVDAATIVGVHVTWQLCCVQVYQFLSQIGTTFAHTRAKQFSTPVGHTKVSISLGRQWLFFLRFKQKMLHLLGMRY